MRLLNVSITIMSLFVCFSFFGFAETSHAQEPLKIAVAEFRADGVPKEVANQVSDLIAIELDKFGSIEVISRSDFLALIKREQIAQFLGCDENCPVNLVRAMEASHLLSGSIGKIGSKYSVNVSLINAENGKVVNRVSQTLTGGMDDVISSIRTITVVLVTGDPKEAGSELVASGEVTADILERVRVAQRRKRIVLQLTGGVTMPLNLTQDRESPLSGAGLLVRLNIDYFFLPYLAVSFAPAFNGYMSKFNHDIIITDLLKGVTAQGVYQADTVIRDISGTVAIKVRRPYGLVLPYLWLGGSVDYLILDAGDLKYIADEGYPEELPFGMSKFEMDGDSGLGFSVRAGAGVDFIIWNFLGVTLDGSFYHTFHSLERTTKNMGEEEVIKLSALDGVLVSTGLNFQF